VNARAALDGLRFADLAVSHCTEHRVEFIELNLIKM
jgi:hypothetical protein